MVTKSPNDAGTRISPGLSKILDAMVNDPGRAQPTTLRELRAALLETGVQWSRKGEQEHPQDRASLLIEVDTLISQYGDNASAVGSINIKASEDLSRFIKLSVDDVGPDDAATLGAVRDAIAEQLVGEGGIETDKDDALLIEIDELIARYGAAASAQTFVR
jgi:hypothetical protein